MEIGRLSPIVCKASLRLALAIALTGSNAAYADSAELANLLVSLSNARGDAMGRATRVQACPQLLRQRTVADLILKYDDARTAHNSLLEGWSRALATAQMSPIDIPSQQAQLDAAQTKVRDFADAARAALLRSGCFSTKTNWLGALALAIAPIAVDKLWGVFQNSVGDDAKRKELIKDLQGYRLPPWESVGPVAVFDWTTESYLTAETATFETLKKGATGIYVNKFTLLKEPNRYFTSYKELPPGLKGSYFLYTGPLEELSEYTVFKGKGSLLEQIPPR